MHRRDGKRMRMEEPSQEHNNFSANIYEDMSKQMVESPQPPRIRGVTTSQTRLGGASHQPVIYLSPTKPSFPKSGRGKLLGSRKNRVEAAHTDHDTSLYQAIQTSNATLTNIVDEWIESYKINREAALIVLMQFFIDSSGCKGRITQEMQTSMEYATIIRKMTEEFDVESSEYPLAMAGPSSKKFSKNYCDFVQILVKQCQYPNFCDRFLMNNITSLLIGLSESLVQAFRHTGTLGAFKLMTALVDVALMVLVNLDNIEHQYEAEKQSTREKHAGNKLELLLHKKQELEENINEIKIMLTHMFKSVFVHRYCDTLIEIRAIAMTEIGIWMHKFHEHFLDDSYLKYIGWTLYDEVGEVRLRCLQALQPLYAKKEWKDKLETFTNKFKDRIVAMTLDEEYDVAVQAVQLVISVLKHRKEFQTDKDFECFYELNSTPVVNGTSLKPLSQPFQSDSQTKSISTPVAPSDGDVEPSEPTVEATVSDPIKDCAPPITPSFSSPSPTTSTSSFSFNFTPNTPVSLSDTITPLVVAADSTNIISDPSTAATTEPSPSTSLFASPSSNFFKIKSPKISTPSPVFSFVLSPNPITTTPAILKQTSNIVGSTSNFVNFSNATISAPMTVVPLTSTFKPFNFSFKQSVFTSPLLVPSITTGSIFGGSVSSSSDSSNTSTMPTSTTNTLLRNTTFIGEKPSLLAKTSTSSFSFAAAANIPNCSIFGGQTKPQSTLVDTATKAEPGSIESVNFKVQPTSTSGSFTEQTVEGKTVFEPFPECYSTVPPPVGQQSSLAQNSTFSAFNSSSQAESFKTKNQTDFKASSQGTTTECGSAPILEGFSAPTPIAGSGSALKDATSHFDDTSAASPSTSIAGPPQQENLTSTNLDNQDTLNSR